jgi:hypothetical protein
MTTIGLMLTPGDAFALQGTELLVGPMVLARVTPFRFTNQNIDPVTLQVSGEKYSGNGWRAAKPERPAVILDLTLPCTVREEAECSLLSQTPHSKRIDLDRFELLQLLAADEEFNASMLPVQPLDSWESLMEALGRWGGVVIKRRDARQGASPLIIESLGAQPGGASWRVSEPYHTRLVDEEALKAWVEPRINSHSFLQRFCRSVGLEGRALSLLMTIQQRRDGAWTRPTVHCILATDGPFASITAGGEYRGPLFLKNFPDVLLVSMDKQGREKLNRDLMCFGIAIARRIEELVAGPPGVLVLKIALDSALTPQVMEIGARPVAPRKAARNLDFYRELTYFALGLITEERRNLPPPTTPVVIDRRDSPKTGISVRTRISPEDISELVQGSSLWLDISLGLGGRDMLRALHQLSSVGHGQSPPFLSLRVGYAINDFSLQPDIHPANLLAMEEYIGCGAIRKSEVEYMRSTRAPLLQLQFQQLLAVSPGYRPDLIWIEDIDLGLRGIALDHQIEELRRTIAWLEKICLEGQVQSWGINLYNCKSPASAQLVQTMKHLAGPDNHFSHVSGRLPFVDQHVVDKILREGLQFVLIANASAQEFKGMDPQEVAVLRPWPLAKGTHPA